MGDGYSVRVGSSERWFVKCGRARLRTILNGDGWSCIEDCVIYPMIKTKLRTGLFFLKPNHEIKASLRDGWI